MLRASFSEVIVERAELLAAHLMAHLPDGLRNRRGAGGSRAAGPAVHRERGGGGCDCGVKGKSVR
jgi:hypothetical protein